MHRQPILGQVRLVAEETLVTARAGVWKRKREELMNRRTALFKRYEKSPGEHNLALEIKSIDDQIAECTHQIECENRRLEPVREVPVWR